MEQNRIYGYGPVIDEKSRILVLGSMPSVVSLEKGFYYAHPRNAFWAIMAEILGAQRPETVEEKKALLLTNGIALWDAAASCVRAGSLDSAIREVRLNDFAALFERYPGIERVLLNGGTAWSLYHRLEKRLVESRLCVKLPSTSPAYTMKYENKLTAWRAAINGGGDAI